MTPDQLQWVLDHNLQIRAGHRVQIAEAVEAWRADQARIAALEREVARLKMEQASYEKALKRYQDQSDGLVGG